MPHVSSKRVKKKVFNRISDELIATVSKLKGAQEIKGFLNELFTPTERVMLAKRLAAYLMIKRGYSFSVIEKTLKMSPSSLVRFWKVTKERHLTFIMKEVNRQKNNQKFWGEIESLLRMGLPPRGSERLAYVNRLRRK